MMNKRITSVMANLNKTLTRFAPLLPALIPILIDLWISQIDSKAVKSQNWDLEYDYIVVGAGTAGSLIAKQLAEKHHKTLLLEAGGNENFFNHIPALAHLLRQTSMDWQYVTEPQANGCIGLEERRSQWPRGRVIGGTSSIDDMLYANGNPEDYDQWERMGAKGWSWEEVRRQLPLRIIKPSKKYTPEDIEENLQKRIEETMTVHNKLRSLNRELMRTFLLSGRQQKYKFIERNTRSQIGFSFPLFSIRNGQRQSSAKQHLNPLPKHMSVVNYAFVQKIIFDNMTATAVQFERFGYTYTVRVKEEVILSAGAINSPQILMLSGIGPKKHLKSLNISVVKDLHVGHNLQDQYGTELSFAVKRDSIINFQKDMNAIEFGKYLFLMDGLLMKPPVESVALINTVNGTQSVVPNLQLTLKPMGFGSDPRLKRLYGIENKFWNHFSKQKNKDLISITVNLLHPKSRGTIRLKSTDPKISPKINPKYFSDSDDMKTLIDGMKFVHKLIKSNAFDDLRAKSLGKPKQCAKYQDSGPDVSRYYECFARHLTLTGYSPIGTCRMGDPSSADSVVDPQLRVIGVKGLRVADASVMPTQVSGGPSAAVQMIGKRVANDIIELCARKLVSSGFQDIR